ncbi:MAG: hypothetical protein PeribacterA2_0341 [Candidatus Peribacter riflensis]|uniref:Uncharacterized protein n=1 Tax=Candidatus Peribacter riflensis TaxID=1735162 RepID=A0A0S1SIA8_9BACT|nr:MAG: hypothetical protein PeribacterA2_0341 [Candidatus Peribacter riflensis]ALM10834.1 MAG: hypothetical protein PeribacterB2_0341 [Candidatus Peribacter riflensis]ALM11936.1 MAG: hypothetical protein PeribacterC2_0340 [Candidatus Peribacter riflensis]ALM13039.1 MAG: hypothetical protein PeribacterD1_0341 [Candidatus Peribacter riflensis]ALM14139.1 MAG: hypothetical protein PeribacterD2_0340 [Candidatus Peribacter riflensis]
MNNTPRPVFCRRLNFAAIMPSKSIFHIICQPNILFPSFILQNVDIVPHVMSIGGLPSVAQSKNQPTSAPFGSYGRHPPLRGGWWAGRDSNPRRRKPPDLQSGPFDHFGTDPRIAAEIQRAEERQSDSPRRSPQTKPGRPTCPSVAKLFFSARAFWSRFTLLHFLECARSAKHGLRIQE